MKNNNNKIKKNKPGGCLINNISMEFTCKGVFRTAKQERSGKQVWGGGGRR